MSYRDVGVEGSHLSWQTEVSLPALSATQDGEAKDTEDSQLTYIGKRLKNLVAVSDAPRPFRMDDVNDYQSATYTLTASALTAPRFTRSLQSWADTTKCWF